MRFEISRSKQKSVSSLVTGHKAKKIKLELDNLESL